MHEKRVINKQEPKRLKLAHKKEPKLRLVQKGDTMEQKLISLFLLTYNAKQEYVVEPGEFKVKVTDNGAPCSKEMVDTSFIVK